MNDTADIAHKLRHRPGLTDPWELEVWFRGRLHSRSRFSSEGKALSSLSGQTDDLRLGQKNDLGHRNSRN